MARGNGIIVTAEPRGQFESGYIASGSTVLLPGTIWQKDASVALIHGAHTFTIYNRDADGNMPAGSYWVLLHNYLLGKTNTDAWTAGDFAMFYSPRAGEELNLLYANISGTADDHAKGEIGMVDDGTGKIIATTGSPESEVCILKETITDPTADTLAWVEWSGN